MPRSAKPSPRKRTQETIHDALPQLLEEKGMSARQLARTIGLNQSYLSLVLGGRRPPSAKLLAAASEALGLPADYFREAREAIVLERIKGDPRLLDTVYEIVRKTR